MELLNIENSCPLHIMINFFFQLFMMRVKQGEIKKGSETQLFSEPYLRTPSGIRTLDPLIKSQLLYQLS